jgi:hypothetical protein
MSSSSSQDQTPKDTGTGTQAAPPRDSGRQYVPRQASQYEDTATRYETADAPSGAAIGLTIAAAVMMMLSGAWNFFEGLAAVIHGSFVVAVVNSYVYSWSATGWGWFHLILGAVVFAVGAALFTDTLWARMAGVVVASVSAIINFLYIPYLPVWSIVLIAIDVAIIWALLQPRSRYA